MSLFETMRRRPNLRPGFSMIELVVVVAIMAVLMFVVAPGVIGYVKKARVETTRTNLQTITQAIGQYKRVTGQFPQTLTDLIEKPSSMTARQWGGPFLGDEYNPMTEPPKDGWGQEFVYQLTPGSEKPFEIYSLGREGDAGTEEDYIRL